MEEEKGGLYPAVITAKKRKNTFAFNNPFKLNPTNYGTDTQSIDNLHL